MSNTPHPAVFISSTQRDLDEYRVAVRDTILSFELFPIMLEYFSAMDADAVQACMDKVSESNLYLGIFAHRYGFCPEGWNISITELEFDHATKNSIPRLCFFIDEDAPWLREHFEDEPGMAKLKQFKAKIDATLIRAKFSTPESLRVEVAKALHNHFGHRNANLSIGRYNITNVTIPIANDSSTSASARARVQVILSEPDVRNFDSTTFKNALSGMLGISPDEITILRVISGSPLVYVELPTDACVQLYKLTFGELADSVLIQDGNLLSLSDLPVVSSEPAILGDKQPFRLLAIAILRELMQPPRNTLDMPRRVELCRWALALLTKAQNDQLWATLQNELANSLAQNPQGNRAENIEQAIGYYQQALTVRTQDAIPIAWAETKMNLANACFLRIRGDKADNIEQAIRYFEQALTELTKPAMPVEWAETKMNLAIAYYARIRGNKAENIEQAIEYYEQALTVRTQPAMPAAWAQTINHLAIAYYARIRGNKAENIEQAIEYYEQALTVRTQDAMPVEWAETKLNLAIAYCGRIREDKAHNIEEAIGYYDQALIVLTQDAIPVAWAQTINNLANAYVDRIWGNKATNIEVAIEYYRQALTVRTKTAMPVEWAETINNLAIAYGDRIRGNKADNIEEAIGYYGQALSVLTQDDIPVAWAETINNLANAYRNRIREDKADNIEQAIRYYRQALTVRTQDAMPVAWAQTTMNLGIAYYSRIRGDKAENIEQAIRYYRQARTVLTQDDLPVAWAETINNLANAYRNRIREDKAENIEQAIGYYRQALTVRTKTALPIDWAQTRMNLANAYYLRVRGDKADNIEQAIRYYQQALTIRTKTAMRVEWATAKMNLAIAYSDRIRGDRADNIEQAIRYYKQALTVRTRTDMRVDWAQTINNLAIAYSDRIRGDKADNIEEAIRYYKQALTVRTKTTMRVDWAQTTNNLATAYSDRIRGDKADNIERAIRYYKQALTVRTKTAMPVDWVQTINNLAIAYSDRIRGDKADNIEQAIRYYQEALTVPTLPADHRLIQRNLGNLYFREKRWGDAETSYAAAIEIGNDLLATAFTDAGRRSEISETAALYVNAAYCLLQLNDPGSALVQLEAGKTRLLAEALALTDANLEGLSQKQRRTYQKARKTVRELESEYRLPPNTPTRRNDRKLSALLESERGILRKLIATIREVNPDFMPEGLKLPAILALIPEGGALVAPLFTVQGSALFVCPHGTQTVNAEHIVLLDDFTTDDLNTLLWGTTQDPGWLRLYILDRQAWKYQINAFTSRLWDVLVGKIHARLIKLGIQPEGEIILMPQGGLGLLPLHAAWRTVDDKPRFLLDEYVIRYAPSAYALNAAQRRSSQHNGDHTAMIAGVSKYSKLNPLPNVAAEVTRIARQFAVQPLLDNAVSRSAIIKAATGKAYLHLACHGAFAWGDAFMSALFLANDEPLPLSEIMSKLNLNRSRLVTLSACETGITDVSQSPDEYLGLPAGFMQAGAPGVVSSLWTVDDRSTSFLMGAFYEKIKQGMQPAAALKAAQVWLRDLTLEEEALLYRIDAQLTSDPRMGQSEYDQMMSQLLNSDTEDGTPYEQLYHWAAFTLTGM